MRRIVSFFGFFLFYIKELVLANLQVARGILSVHPHMTPGIIAIPLDINRNISLLLLANLLTMTPGTLSLDISTDRKVLYLHMLYLEEDPEVSRARIKQTFEKRILELFEK